MRIMAIVLWISLLTTVAYSDDPTSTVDSSDEKLGYAIGHQVGRDFRRDGAQLDADAVVAGVRDALEGAAPRWSVREMRDALRRLEQNRRSSPAVAP